MLNKFLILPAFLLVIPGCNADTPEELDRLKKEDAAFRQMVDSRDQVHAQIRTIKHDLLAKKNAADAQVQKIKSDYDLYAKAQNQKIEQYQNLIDSHRGNLKEQIQTLSAELSVKQKELAGYEETHQDLKKLRTAKGLRFSAQERQNFEEKILMVSEKIRPLSEEIQELKTQIRLKKKKIRFLH